MKPAIEDCIIENDEIVVANEEYEFNGQSQGSLESRKEQGKGKAAIVGYDAFDASNNEYEEADGDVFMEASMGFIHLDDIGIDQDALDESFCSNILDSPNGTRYWIPDVPFDQKPVTGIVYPSFEEARKMYECYAEKAGFSTRLSTVKRKKDEVRLRYIVCHKAGKSRSKSLDTLEGKPGGVVKRRSTYKVTNCAAGVKFKVIPGTSSYKLYDFVEAHNHELLEDENKDFSRARRKLNYGEKQYIHRLSMSNIGPSVAYRLRALCSGGYNRVRGTVVDFKNFRRDLNIWIGDRDAQMLVDKMTNRMLHVPNFSFYYKCVNSELVGLFWADEISKCNYEVFGDVLAFDATYRTNKYKMVFVPFTGVDHNKKCVTFGGGLLASDTIESYKWLLQSFLKAHVKQPMLVLTDQDAAVKEAVASTFIESSHRLCMWHIMDKLPVKISGDILANTDLRRCIHKLVWNTYLSPDEFEDRWTKLIDEHDLGDNKWLHDMYQIRHRWIPGYFKDLPMCCLMKTTSRAESSNAMFRIYSHPDNTLVQFMMCFETAMETQRYMRRKLDNKTKTTTPKFVTHLPIERYAANVYSHELFTEVQKEIWKGAWSCSPKSVRYENGCHVRIVVPRDKRSQVVSEFKVVINLEEQKMDCSCLNFGRIGYLCCHIFSVLKDLSVDEIPDNYVLPRWRRDALPGDILKIPQFSRSVNDKRDGLFSDVVNIAESCASRLRGDTEKLALFVEKLKQMQDEVFSEIPHEPLENSNEEVFKSLLGVSEPKEVLIKAAQGIRNKGCGTNKRMIGPGEKAAAKSKKNPRLCALCKKYVIDHDARTCHLNPKNKHKMSKVKKRKECSTSKGECSTSKGPRESS